MAKVTVNSLLRDVITANGQEPPKAKVVDIEANSVRRLIEALEQRYPGCGAPLSEAAVAIDGEIYSDALTEPLDELSEVVFIPQIGGG
jgi:molybdopterin converting factor small subunit